MLSNGAKKIPSGFDCVAENNCKSPNPSMRHALAIREAIQKATGDYIVIADADIALLYKGWDEIIIKTLDDYSCFGSASPSNEYGEQDFPNVPFFAFKKELIQKVKLDFTPILDEKYILKSVRHENKKMMGRGIGELVFFETGCKLPSEFKKAGLKSKCLEAVGVNSKKIQLNHGNFKNRIIFNMIKNRDLRCSHNKLFEYHYDKKIFLTHLGQGMSLISERAKSWKSGIEKYLNDQGVNNAC